MKKIILLFLLFIFILSSQAFAKEKDLFDELKEWEYNVMLGYKGMLSGSPRSASTVSIRAQKRIGYPFLLGVEGEAALIRNMAYLKVGVPFSVRLGLADRVKLDFMVSPGGIYVNNTSRRVQKFAGAGTIGAEVKYFYKSGNSIGLGINYTATTNHTDSCNLVSIVGF